MIRLAVDAMGGDFAPAEIVAGALSGARQAGLALCLVGDADAVHHELAQHPSDDLTIEVVHAAEVIHMADDPVRAVRERPEASINVACRLVQERQADGLLTMGHTGAGMVAAMFAFGRLPGVDRPAALVPFLGLRPDLYLIDVGANTEVRPQHLLQFAHMGAAYAASVAGISEPRVGLLSNGAEPNKGNRVGREAYNLLQSEPGLNFIGNVEGHTLLTGGANVVVADGFAGNVLLKFAEGLVPGLLQEVAGVLADLPAETAETLRTRLKALGDRTNYAHYGASALLGLQKPVFIGHGRSKALAVHNGVLTAGKAIAADVVAVIRRALAGQAQPG